MNGILSFVVLQGRERHEQRAKKEARASGSDRWAVAAAGERHRERNQGSLGLQCISGFRGSTPQLKQNRQNETAGKIDLGNMH